MKHHTPTPWTKDDDYSPGYYDGSFIKSQGKVIGSTFGGCDYDEDDGQIGEEEDKANVEFIILACNSHEALVDALSDLRDAVHGGGFPHEAVKRADAVLAMAKGK